MLKTYALFSAVALVGSSAALSAHAADYTIESGQHVTSQQNLADSDTLTVMRGAIIETTQPGQSAVSAPLGATITNHGTLRTSGACCSTVDLGSDNKVINTGSIVRADNAAPAISATGTGNTVVNSGNIIAASGNSAAIDFGANTAQNNTISLLAGSRIFGSITLSTLGSDKIDLSGLGSEGVDMTVTSVGGQPIVTAPAGRQVAIKVQGGGAYRIVVDPVVSLAGMTKLGFDTISHINTLNENWAQDEGRLRFGRDNSVWGRTFGSTNRRDDADTALYGFATGADVRVARDFTASGYLGYIGGHSLGGGDRELNTYFGGIAGRYDNKHVHASISANYGQLDAAGSDVGFGRAIIQNNALNEGYRTNASGGGEAKQKLDGNFYSTTAHIGLRMAKYGKVHFNPFASVSYTRFEHDGIDGAYVSLTDQTHSAITSRIGLTAMTSFWGMVFSATGGREFRRYSLIDGTQKSMNFADSDPVALENDSMWIYGASLTRQVDPNFNWKIKFEGRHGDKLSTEKVELSGRYQF